MIQLKVHDFCHNCPEFNPEVIERPSDTVFMSFDPLYGEKEKHVVAGNTVVSCKDSCKCMAIANNYIKNNID